MDMEIPPLEIIIMLESNPLKSIMLVGEPGVCYILYPLSYALNALYSNLHDL